MYVLTLMDTLFYDSLYLIDSKMSMKEELKCSNNNF